MKWFGPDSTKEHLMEIARKIKEINDMGNFYKVEPKKLKGANRYGAYIKSGRYNTSNYRNIWIEGDTTRIKLALVIRQQTVSRKQRIVYRFLNDIEAYTKQLNSENLDGFNLQLFEITKPHDHRWKVMYEVAIRKSLEKEEQEKFLDKFNKIAKKQNLAFERNRTHHQGIGLNITRSYSHEVDLELLVLQSKALFEIIHRAESLLG